MLGLRSSTISPLLNKSTNIDGSQIKTETETSDFIPIGIMGDEGFAFPGWSFRFGGVEKFPFIKKIARTATIEHVFNGKQTKGAQRHVYCRI